MNKLAVFFTIICLLGPLIAPVWAAPATEITGIVEPEGDLGTFSVGSSFGMHFEVQFSGASRAMSIIQVGCPEAQAAYEGMTATMGGADVSDQFDAVYSEGTVMVNCTDISPMNGLLVVDLQFRAGSLEGNFTVDWRNVAVAYQAPPNPPVTYDNSGSSNFEVIYGVDVSFFNGWNLLGVPVNLRESSISGAFGPRLGMVEYVYGFDNEAKEFTFWIKGLPDGVQTVKTLEAGKGYWVLTTGNFTRTLLFRGFGPAPGGKSPLDGKTVKIGYISASTTALDTGQSYHEQIIAPDLNAYARLLGYNVTFQFVCEDAQSQVNIHLQKVQGFKDQGITIFEGGGWSSQAQGSLNYCNQNGMLMFSSSSTSPTLAIAGDRLFRMCPADSAMAPALVEMMWSYGIKEVVIFSRGDSWGDGIVNLFRPAWTAKGGALAGATIRYAAEPTDFTSYLDAANTQATAAVARQGGDTERVGVLLLSFDEFPVIAQQAQNYLPLYDCPFFGSDGTARSIRGMDDAPQQVNHMRVFSLLSQSPATSKYNALAARYEALTSQPLNTYTANSYDIAWIIAQAVLQAQSDKADDIAPLIMPIAYNTYGASGWCQLNEFGDRVPPPYDVWFFAPGATTPSASYKGGTYDPDTHIMSWDVGALSLHLGYVPAGP